MPSSENYLASVLEKLSGVPEITWRPMMGEYLIYCREKVVGGIYDDRLLVKPTKSADRYLPDSRFELPYAGAKPMLRVPDSADSDLLTGLFSAVADDLPAPAKKKKAGKTRTGGSP